MKRMCLLAIVTACGGSEPEAEPSRDASTDAASDAGSPPLDVASLRLTRQPERTFRGQIFEGDASLASDPCVLRDGDTWRMFYTCVAGAATGGFCEVTSTDGIGWTPAASPLSAQRGIEGLIAEGRAGRWDASIETCTALRENGALSIYYSGYEDLDETGNRPPAALGLLRSTDGLAFERVGAGPVLEATPGGRDGDDIFSPIARRVGEDLELLYVGWCVNGYHDGLPCAEGPSTQLLGATRTAAGTWQKHPDPVLAPRPDPSFMRNGVAEPDQVQLPDGRWLLLFTGNLGDDEARVTSLAVGPTPAGPWEVAAQPALVGEVGGADACGAFAPSAVIDGEALRVWYLALGACPDGTCQSCDESGTCTCDPRFSIGYAEASLAPR